MNARELRSKAIAEARKRIVSEDPSHDIHHSLRVLSNAEYIAQHEGGDLEVIIPAAAFHDVVNHPKDDPRSAYSADESAVVAREILQNLEGYDVTKIESVETAIREHPYSKKVKPVLLESQIVQDADRLEATGAISIMRTFSSAGQMNVPFYHPQDPFCERREPENIAYALDLFYTRLLKVEEIMNTKTARRVAEQRTMFLEEFLEQLRVELGVEARS